MLTDFYRSLVQSISSYLRQSYIHCCHVKSRKWKGCFCYRWTFTPTLLNIYHCSGYQIFYIFRQKNLPFDNNSNSLFSVRYFVPIVFLNGCLYYKIYNHSFYNFLWTGTVDDHFARALGGDTWNQIKSQKEAVNMDIYTGSVDDHFAKALGDTWYKIKAEKESSRSPEGSSRSSSSSPAPPPRSSSRSPSSQTSIRHT